MEGGDDTRFAKALHLWDTFGALKFSHATVQAMRVAGVLDSFDHKRTDEKLQWAYDNIEAVEMQIDRRSWKEKMLSKAIDFLMMHKVVAEAIRESKHKESI